jgi:hypothetical protein
MRRRELLLLLTGPVAAGRALHAQQKPTPVIGHLASASPGPFAPFVAAFHQGLSETGYVEGQNVAIEYRWAEGRYDPHRASCAQCVRRALWGPAAPREKGLGLLLQWQEAAARGGGVDRQRALGGQTPCRAMFRRFSCRSIDDRADIDRGQARLPITQLHHDFRPADAVIFPALYPGVGF